jgi:hypothetical protein
MDIWLVVFSPYPVAPLKNDGRIVSWDEMKFQGFHRPIPDILRFNQG